MIYDYEYEYEYESYPRTNEYSTSIRRNNHLFTQTMQLSPVPVALSRPPHFPYTVLVIVHVLYVNSL